MIIVRSDKVTTLLGEQRFVVEDSATVKAFLNATITVKTYVTWTDLHKNVKSTTSDPESESDDSEDFDNPDFEADEEGLDGLVQERGSGDVGGVGQGKFYPGQGKLSAIFDITLHWHCCWVGRHQLRCSLRNQGSREVSIRSCRDALRLLRLPAIDTVPHPAGDCHGKCQGRYISNHPDRRDHPDRTGPAPTFAPMEKVLEDVETVCDELGLSP